VSKNGSRTRGRVLAAGAVAVSLFTAACSSGGGSGSGSNAGAGEGPVEDPKEPVTISFSSWVGNEPSIQKMYEAFHKEHPNITIEFQNVPAEESNEKLTAQIAGGNAPDAAFVDASTTAGFASRHAVVDLTNYIERSDVVDPDDYVDAFKTFTTYEDSLYGLPFDGESTALFYRTDLFEEAGIDAPPTNWDEFQQAAEKLTDPAKKQYGIAMFAPESAYYWYPWLWQAGGELQDGDNQPAWTSDEAKEAAEYYVGLTEYAPPDYLNSNSYDGRVAFAQGQVGMYVAGAWFAGTLSQEFPDIEGKWATAPLPEGDAGCGTTIAGDALVLFDGKNNDAAWLWIEYLSRPENMATWTYKAEGSTLLPPRKSLLESPDLEKEKPVLKGFADAMACGVSNVIADPEWGRKEEALNEELGKAMYGEQSAADALENAAAEASN
jgi:multiple sugar transport system substrate-binding protein